MKHYVISANIRDRLNINRAICQMYLFVFIIIIIIPTFAQRIQQTS